MAKGKDDDDEILPTPEQAQAYAERARAVIALARFDKYCAGLPAAQISSHVAEHGCILLTSLGQTLAVVEYNGGVGLAAPAVHSNWLEDFPFDFIAVTKSELFFVTKGFTWLGAEVQPMGISMGSLLPTSALARLCHQSMVHFFSVKGDMANTFTGEPLRKDRPVPLYQVPENIEVLKTRQHFERIAMSNRTDQHTVITDHFLG